MIMHSLCRIQAGSFAAAETSGSNASPAKSFPHQTESMASSIHYFHGRNHLEASYVRRTLVVEATTASYVDSGVVGNSRFSAF
jgi:hypothetical protein